MNRSALFAASATAALFLTSAAMAGDTVNASNDSNDSITIEQASQYLRYSGGNDRMRVEIAPNYSEELGFSLKGAVGSYLTDEIALGLIVEYGENKREYLANAGIQFTDALSFFGTVGMLEEHNEYVDGEGREEVQQMEYGASFKGAYEVGFLSGFELNGYLADADADSDSVETGKLYGVQLLADLDLTDTTHFKLGGGYEWLEWDDTNDDDSSWTFSAEAAQQLGDTLSLNGHAKLGASEYVYGGGLAFDLSNGGPNSNTIGVNYSYIDGKNGIEDDQRVELSWSVGFGAGPSTSVAAADLTDKSGTIRAAADFALVSPANNLLGDVLKRPAFLPERVLARRKASSGPAVCSDPSAIAFTTSDQSLSGAYVDAATTGGYKNPDLTKWDLGYDNGYTFYYASGTEVYNGIGTVTIPTAIDLTGNNAVFSSFNFWPGSMYVFVLEDSGCYTRYEIVNEASSIVNPASCDELDLVKFYPNSGSRGDDEVKYANVYNSGNGPNGLGLSIYFELNSFTTSNQTELLKIANWRMDGLQAYGAGYGSTYYPSPEGQKPTLGVNFYAAPIGGATGTKTVVFDSPAIPLQCQWQVSPQTEN